MYIFGDFIKNYLLFLFFIIGLFNSCDNKIIKTETDKLHQFFSEEWENGLINNPESATWYGDDRFNNLLNDRSIEKLISNHGNNISSLKNLVQIKRSQLDENNQLNYDLYKQDLKTTIEGYEYKNFLIPITQLGGVQIDLPNMVELMPFNNTKDFHNYFSRMRAIPTAIEQTINVMKRGIKENIMPPKVTIEKVSTQIKKQTEIPYDESPFYTPYLNIDLNISNALKDSLKQIGKLLIYEQIIPAYQKLNSFFLEEYYPNARDDYAITSIPNGGKYYNYLVKYHTTTDKTPKEIHQIGKDEVNRIRKEMDEIILTLNFDGEFSDFLNFLRTSPEFYYDKPEDLLNGYRAICKRVDPELASFFGKLPRIPYGVKPIPEYQAMSSPTAYYYGASADGKRPGYFWANTYNLKMRPKYEMAVLAIHEAVPGHHLQISLANEMEDVPTFRKHSGHTAFIEGWGLYSESLGDEMGIYDTPYSKFGQLTYEMWRACRLVVDTGIHAFGWSRIKSIQYMSDNTAKTIFDIENEIDRYIAWPGQALAYKIGELKIKEIRKNAENILGDEFDIREFHDKLLESGSLPLDILENKMAKYIRDKSKL
ncbi:MAG: DUF885 domain-containing protein [Candidatus Marinimicrobia bacterium]|nr:DUF885 domain-containing protein [Candidatus Neomarinimicrobiota bacterium]